MEEQLKDLDGAIALEEQSNSGRLASRRAEAKLPSRLQWHRLDLLGRSFAKVEQYSEQRFPKPLSTAKANGLICCQIVPLPPTVT